MKSSFHRVRGFSAAILSLGLFSASASAAVLFSESFTYPNGTTLQGSGGWYIPSSDSTSHAGFTVTDGSISTEGSHRAAYRNLGGTPITTGSIYYGFDLVVGTLTPFTSKLISQLSSAPDGGGFTSGAALLQIQSRDDSAFNEDIGDFDDVVTGYRFRVNAGGSYSNSAYFDLTDLAHRVVVEYNFVEGAKNNTASLYIDGTHMTTSTWTSGADEQGMLSFSLFQSVLSQVDNLVVATTFGEASTTAVPEPSAYAAIVGGLALAGVVLRRRRRA
jgi:hypothetical protein